MTCLVAVTFESESRPCREWRGTVTAGSAPTLVSRAVKAAKRAYPAAGWRSLTICVLERLVDSPVRLPRTPSVQSSEANASTDDPDAMVDHAHAQEVPLCDLP